MDDVEQALFDGWRYLEMDVEQVLSKTPREFSILLEAQVERQYDEYEHMSKYAMMMRGAYHAKKLKASDLFKRPENSVAERNDLSDMKVETERLNEWLAGLTTARKEETDA